MPTTTNPMTREAKLRRYVELSAFESFLEDVGYLFEGLLGEDAIAAVHPDNLRPRELDTFFEELWPKDFSPSEDEPADYTTANAAHVLAARMCVRAAGESAWFSRMADRRLAPVVDDEREETP